MIRYEQYNETLTRAYSDNHVMIERDGVQYIEAIDPTSLGRTYTETDVPIVDAPEEDATIDDYKQALAELGIEEEGETDET